MLQDHELFTYHQSVAETHRWEDESDLVGTWGMICRGIEESMKEELGEPREPREPRELVVMEELVVAVVVECCGEGTAREKLRACQENYTRLLKITRQGRQTADPAAGA